MLNKGRLERLLKVLCERLVIQIVHRERTETAIDVERRIDVVSRQSKRVEIESPGRRTGEVRRRRDVAKADKRHWRPLAGTDRIQKDLTIVGFSDRLIVGVGFVLEFCTG